MMKVAEMEIVYDPSWFVEYRTYVNQGEDPECADKKAFRLREDIIVTNLYLCKRVVGKMKKTMPSHVERDDLESWAKIGLLQAVTRFDNSLGVPFEAFATQRMRSVIMDGIRDADWAPRSLRKKHRDITKLEESYRQQYGTNPTAEQLARLVVEAEYGFENEEVESDYYQELVAQTVTEISDVKYQSDISAHAYIEGNLEAQNKPTTYNESEDELVDLLKATVGSSLATMAARKAVIIAMHYYREKKLFDIASILSMSEVKVGELHAEAIAEIWSAVKRVTNSDE